MPDRGPRSANALELAALSRALPEKMRAAAQAIAVAERHLAGILICRATGQILRVSTLASARMALARTLRDAEDLRRIQSELPAMLAAIPRAA